MDSLLFNIRGYTAHAVRDIWASHAQRGATYGIEYQICIFKNKNLIDTLKMYNGSKVWEGNKNLPAFVLDEVNKYEYSDLMQFSELPILVGSTEWHDHVGIEVVRPYKIGDVDVCESVKVRRRDGWIKKFHWN